MFFYNFIPRTLYPDILNYIKESEDKIDKVYVYIDIQNYSAAFTDAGIDLYVNGSTFSDLFNELLYNVSNIIKNLSDMNLKSHVFLYTDINRNFFNSNIIREWKEDRRKELIEIEENEQNCLIRDANIYMNRFIKTGLKAIKNLVNITYNATICILENIDSDFFPALVINKTKDKKNILHLIISNDHDYIHLIDKPNIVRYSRSYKKYENYPSLETVYNRAMFLKKQLDISDSSIAKKITDYYQIFHALSGDPTDNIKPIKARMSYKTWGKKVNFNGPVNQVIDDLLDNKFKIEDIDNTLILERLIIFDFNITSKLILNILDKKHDKILDFVENHYLVNKEILVRNSKLFVDQVLNERYILDDIDKVFNKFNINTTYIPYLWMK
ncbi:MAG: hypothetical protein QW478_07035 [Candidatus Micrarchaeaceae archaeon]